MTLLICKISYLSKLILKYHTYAIIRLQKFIYTQLINLIIKKTTKPFKIKNKLKVYHYTPISHITYKSSNHLSIFVSKYWCSPVMVISCLIAKHSTVDSSSVSPTTV